MANYDAMRDDVVSNKYASNKWVVQPVDATMSLETMLTNRDVLYIFQEFWSQKLSEQTHGAFSGDKRAITNISAIMDHQDTLINDYNDAIEAINPGMSAYYPQKPQECTYGNEAEPACKMAINEEAKATIEALKNAPPGSYVDPATGDIVNVNDEKKPDYALYVLLGLAGLVAYKMFFKKKNKRAA